MKPLIILLLFCVSHLQAENSCGVESNLISLAEMVVPHIDMSDGATLSEAVDYLNLLFRAPDPPPPTSWKMKWSTLRSWFGDSSQRRQAFDVL